MARANLNINTQINEEFLRANESNDVRILKIKIEEEDLVLDGVVNKVSTVQEDFNTVLPESVQDTQASFILIRVTDEVFDSCAWALIAWVPDGCRVRDKMLYSSSREDLKRCIGLSFLKAEYAANTRSDLTWQQYLRSQDKTVTSDLFTESERLVLEEKVRTFFLIIPSIIKVNILTLLYYIHINIVLIATSSGRKHNI